MNAIGVHWVLVPGREARASRTGLSGTLESQEPCDGAVGLGRISAVGLP